MHGIRGPVCTVIHLTRNYLHRSSRKQVSVANSRIVTSTQRTALVSGDARSSTEPRIAFDTSSDVTAAECMTGGTKLCLTNE
jgi:hypothetical protein